MTAPRSQTETAGDGSPTGSTTESNSASTSGSTSGSTLRWRWVAACLGLVALAFVQDPGRIAADTKLDLIVNPGGLLTRALDLWEPLGFLGQLTNQGYGYLFPLGPFFLVGDLLPVPDWAVQRLWWSTLLVVAFLGVVRLSRLLGVIGFLPRLIAGLAFALGPRMITELGVLSVEVLPYALAPWVLIPLVSVANGGSYRRAAAWSGLAVLAAGGVNAVATAAVLPLAAWWILTRFRGRARWVLAGWWAAAVAAATLWWALPLLVLGRYSPPFLDWIESASITTSITAPDTVIRGTSQWVAYIADTGGPVWPSGWNLVTQPLLILATGLVAAAGIAGLALRSTPWRTFLVGGLLIGWLLVGVGHIGAWPGLGADTMRELLDGALAPLRNTHKFEVLIRLPIAIGVGFALQWVLTRREYLREARRSVRSAVATTVTVMVVLVLTVSTWPALTGGLTRDRSYAAVPDYWAQTSAWLADQEASGRALVLPGASFGVYTWGRANDEPLQAFGEVPWAVRDAVPLASAGAIRWLDAIAERVTTGRGSKGLAESLARAGIDWIVVRNDLDRRRSGSPRPESIRQALLRSGGIAPAVSFGPALPPFRTEATVVDDGLADTTTAIEIWRVGPAERAVDPRVTLRPAGEVLVMSGSAEVVPDLIDAGVIDSGTAIVLAGDDGPLISSLPDTRVNRGVSDTFARSEVIFGRSWANRTAILEADVGYSADRSVHDYLLQPLDASSAGLPGMSVIEFEGGRPSASSSGSDADAQRGIGPGSNPYAALDGDVFTSWVSGDLGPGIGQWWRVDLDEPVILDESLLPIRLVIAGVTGNEPRIIAVTTDQGTVETEVDPTGDWQNLSVRPGRTSFLQVELRDIVDEVDGGGFGIAEIDLPVDVSRIVKTPGRADGGPIILTARRGDRTGCLSVGGIIACSDSLGAYGEERTGIDRYVEIEQGGDYRVAMTVRPRSGAALDSLLQPIDTEAMRASASSQFVTDPAVRAQAAVDGSLETSWVADRLDAQPELTVSWGRPRVVRGVRLSVTPSLAASLPLTVTVIVNGVETTSVVGSTSVVRVPEQEASSLRIRFDNTIGLRSLDPLSGALRPLPVGVSEVSIVGASDLDKGPAPGLGIAVPCGFGPTVSVDGIPRLRTSVDMTVGDALTDAVVPARACSGRTIALEPGMHRIRIPSTAEFTVESVHLEPVNTPWSINRDEAVEVTNWDPAHRTVVVAESSSPRLLELTENHNAGWVATMDGRTLDPIRVDGWRQAWVVPAGMSGAIALDFAPNGLYRTGLLIGGVAVLLLVLALAWPARVFRGPSPIPRERPLVIVGIALACAAALTGVPGLLAAGLGLVLGGLGSRWFRHTRPVVVLAALGGVAVLAAFWPWPQRLSATPLVEMILAGLTVLGLAAAAAPTMWRGSASGGAPSVESASR